jgi:hypothetical protein
MEYATQDVPVTWRSSRAMEHNTNKTIIWMTEERVFGNLISFGAYVSRVEFTDRYGNDCDEMVENDEFEILKEPFTYEQE